MLPYIYRAGILYDGIPPYLHQNDEAVVLRTPSDNGLGMC